MACGLECLGEELCPPSYSACMYVCMYVKDMPIPSRPVELPVYANVMDVRATFRHPTLLFRYLVPGDISQQPPTVAAGSRRRPSMSPRIPRCSQLQLRGAFKGSGQYRSLKSLSSAAVQLGILRETLHTRHNWSSYTRSHRKEGNQGDWHARHSPGPDKWPCLQKRCSAIVL